MKQLINSILYLFGLQLKKRKALEKERNYYSRLMAGMEDLYAFAVSHQQSNESISGLVFSKDRPLQLHALLTSYLHQVINCAPLTVIYKTSDSVYERAYAELAESVSSKPVTFLKETDFHKQVIEWMQAEQSERIFFLTDDAVFLNKVDLADCLKFETRSHIFAMRHGRDLDYSFPFQRNEELPSFTKIEVNGKEFIEWDWQEKKDSPDWVYPLSVDGTIFSRQEMLAVCKAIDFRNPNTLEAAMQVFLQFFNKKKGVSYPLARLVNVPCNLVQSEFENRSTGLYSAEELLTVWSEGKRIDVSWFDGKTCTEAMHARYNFI